MHAQSVAHNAIAIIGMACRFPGEVCDNASLWRLLTERRVAIARIPEERWPVATLQHPERNEPGRSVTFAAATLEALDSFDAAFFGISPREAAWLDPQQRLLLEMAHEAMEDAGVRPSTLAGSACGVYVGISGMDYGQQALADLASMGAYTMTGNTLSLAANRLSYRFDLHGPSLAIDTACSSSLVALHQACQALRSGEIPLALAGGVNVLMHPYAFIGFSKASMLSPSGQCRPFDAVADGYVRGEGGAILLLKPYAQAQRDGDRIHAVILATGVNADGARKNGLTIPSAEAQAELMGQVLAQSGLGADEVDFVEAHGTGTPAGDPVEVASIGRIYGKNRHGAIPITSVKANLGHLEPASGMAGLVKAVLCLQRGEVPPMPLEFTPNPRIDFAASNVHCVAAGVRLPAYRKRPLVAALNSFGFGGVNAHALLQVPVPSTSSRKAGKSPFPPLVLSAQTESSLRTLAGRYAECIAAQEERFHDLAYNAVFCRDRMERRLALWEEPGQVAKLLHRFASGEETARICVENALPHGGRIAFIYAGNGAQWLGMGRRLYAESPVFRRSLDDLDARLHPLAGFSVIAALREDRQENLDDTTISQPLLFAVQVGLTMTLRALGIRPQAVAGHSIGEVAAAWASGALSLQQAIRVICARSKAQGHTRGQGRMAAVGLPVADAEKLLAQYGLADQLVVAGINSSNNVTLAGGKAALLQMQAHLPRKTFFRLLDLDYAFHSACMDGIRGQLCADLAGLRPGTAREARFFSTVIGGEVEGRALNREYWWQNVREPVLFAQTVDKLIDADCRIFVELGPHPILQHYIRDALALRGVGGRVLPTLSRQENGLSRLRELATILYALTEQADISVHFPRKAPHMSLPLYPWQRQSFWCPRTSECAPAQRRVHPLLGWPLDAVEPAWENVLDPAKDRWLTDHKVGDALVFPAAGYAELALAAAREWQGREGVALDYLDIKLPLVFAGGHAQTLRCLLNPADGTVRIMSRPRLGKGEWAEHALARIVTIPAVANIPAPPPLADDAVCLTLDAAGLYDRASAQGLDYGRSFRVVRRLQLSAACVEAELTPSLGTDWGEILPPAALDACFHALVALSALQPERAEQTFLPVKTGRLERLAGGQIATIRGSFHRSGERSLAASFTMLRADGLVVARVEECRFRALPLPGRDSLGVSVWRIQPWLTPLSGLAAEIVPQWNVDALFHAAALVAGGTKREAWYRETLPGMEALVLVFAAQAFQGLVRENGGKLPVLAEPYALWLRGVLAREELLVHEEGDWHLTELELPDADTLWRETLAQAPDILPALLVLARVGHHLPAVLRGLEDGAAVRQEVLLAAVARDAALTDPVFTGIDAAIGAMLQELACQLPAGQCLRVLDIAHTPGNGPELLAQSLSPDQFEYVLVLPDGASERSAHVRVIRGGFAPGQTLADVPGMGFDVVLLRHTLHRSASLAGATAQIGALLKPGGLVLVAERYPDLSADFVAGLDASWWHTVHDQVASSLLAPEAWTGLLSASGFASCRVFREAAAEGLDEGAFLVCAVRKAQAKAEAVRGTERLAHSWSLWADAASLPLADALAVRLREAGQSVSVRTGEAQAGMQIADERFVFMRGFADAPEDASDTLAELLACGKACAAGKQTRLWVLTCGGNLATGFSSQPVRPAQCAVTGLGRVMQSEYSALPLVLLDLPPLAACPELPSLLARELLEPDGETEILLDGVGRYALKVLPGCPQEAERKLARYPRYHLDFTAPGRLGNLQWQVSPEPDLAEDEVEAQVLATGLNFRDIMLTMGLLPDDAVEHGFAGANLGLEFAGRVTRLGSKVQGLAVGDRVMGFARACFASHVCTPARTLARIPETWSFASAATVPTVFFTAWYALKHLAQLQAGETVLIHGAAGGVGLAALQVARHLGARVLATAGSEEKRDFLRLLGEEEIFDSRSVSFVDSVLQATGGAGVDVVLNSLAGEFMRRSLGLLKPFGRFLELGKRDFVENTAVGLRPFKENISYFAIDVDQLLYARPALGAQLFAEIMALAREGVFAPLPFRRFPASRVLAAFRAMQQARHVGKIIVEPADKPPVQGGAVALSPALDTDSTWLVSGGLGGFGLATARHLVELGVRHLVLLGRRGENTPGAAEILAEFSKQGVSARAVACDVGDALAVRELVNRLGDMPPLRGVVHAAAVFADQMLDNMGADELAKVLRPKLSGAWNLHEATREMPLSHFIVYSSVSVALGNPGQGNYVAANAGLEGLTHLRLAEGVPALCLAWGPIGDVGYLTRHETVKNNLARRLGAEPLTVAQAMRCLDSVLGGQGVHIFANMDWNHVPGVAQTPRLAQLLGEAQAGVQSGASLQDVLAGKSRAEALALVQQGVIEEVAQVLALSPDRVDTHRTLQSLGLDSLMAVELAVGLEKRMGVRLPAMMLQDSPSVALVAERILARLTHADDVSCEGVLMADLLRKHSETLGEDEKDRILATGGGAQ